MNKRRARAKTPGSSSATHAIFAPAAWEVREDPPRSRITSSPYSELSRSTCAVARVSTP